MAHSTASPGRPFLDGFRGYLQADAYTGYDALYSSGRIVEVACWAHARRRFVDALETDPRAALVVALVKQLYEVESQAADLEPEARRTLRQERSASVLAELDRQRQALMRDALPKSPLGDALRYLDNQWRPLQRFLEDGRLRIDLPEQTNGHKPGKAQSAASAPLTVLTDEERRDRDRANILAALDACGGKVFGSGGAAELLDVKPTTLASRIKALGIRYRAEARSAT